MLEKLSGALVMAVTRPLVTQPRTILSVIWRPLLHRILTWQMSFLPRRKLLDINQTLSQVRKILVIAPRYPWQTLHATQTIEAIKTAFSQSRLYALGSPATIEILESNPLVDEIIGELPAGMEPLSRQLTRLTRIVQGHGFDLAINLGLEPDLGRLYLIFRSKAVIRVGFRPGKLPSPYNIEVVPSNDVVYEADRYLRLLLPLGIRVEENQLSWTVTKKDREAAGRKLRRLGVRRADSLIAIDCTSDPNEKHFTLDQIQALSDNLAERLKARSLIFVDAVPGSPAVDDSKSMAEVAIPLSDAAHYLVHCQAMITTNTNLFHMGQALDIPSVLLFKSNDVRRWIPEKFGRLERIEVEDLARIPIEQVIQATKRLVSEPA